MKITKFFSFWLLLTLGMATVMFHSCSKNDDDSNIAVTNISLDKATLTLAIGEDYTLKATVTPDNATDKAVTWTSSDPSKATVDNNGKVTAIAAGTATITAKVGDKTTTCLVTVNNGDAGVEINGVTWATCNVAAPGTFVTKPEALGMFYQFNRKIGWNTNLINSNGETGWGNDSEIFYITWEKDNDPSPAGWRVPTPSEIQKLLDTDKVESEWTTKGGVWGRKFTDIATNNSIFLPAAGRLSYNHFHSQLGEWGFYWSNTAPEYTGGIPRGVHIMSFDIRYAQSVSSGHTSGHSVRPVAEK